MGLVNHSKTLIENKGRFGTLLTVTETETDNKIVYKELDDTSETQSDLYG